MVTKVTKSKVSPAVQALRDASIQHDSAAEEHHATSVMFTAQADALEAAERANADKGAE